MYCKMKIMISAQKTKQDKERMCRASDNVVVEDFQLFCDPMDCSPPGSSVHGILQARMLERVVTPHVLFCGNFEDSLYPLLVHTET